MPAQLNSLPKQRNYAWYFLVVRPLSLLSPTRNESQSTMRQSTGQNGSMTELIQDSGIRPTIGGQDCFTLPPDSGIGSKAASQTSVRQKRLRLPGAKSAVPVRGCACVATPLRMQSTITD